MSGITYDAAAVSRITQLSNDCNEPTPEARDGEMVIWYGGWNLKTLLLSPAGKKRSAVLIENLQWYRRMGWGKKYGLVVESGYYRLLLPVPKSDRRTWQNQLRYLAHIDPTYQPAAAIVVASALHIHKMETGNDLLGGGSCRCADTFGRGSQAELHLEKCYVNLCASKQKYGYDHTWLAAMKKA